MALRDATYADRLIDALSSGLLAIDGEGAVVVANAAVPRILRLSEEDPSPWIGRPVVEVLRDRPQVAAVLLDALDGRERPSRAELVLEARGGLPTTTIGFTLTPLLCREGAIAGAAMQFRDVTPYERLGERERLRDRLAALGEMAAGLAHELRNPLAGLGVLAGLLRRRVADRPEALAVVEELSAGLRGMTGTLNETLDFVRPLAPSPETLDPESLLEACLERALARVPFKGRIDRAYADALPQLVADPQALRSALTDLIVNALEAMATLPDDADPRLALSIRAEVHPTAGPPVRVRGTLPAGPAPEARCELVFAIGDSGPGVPPDLRDRIFYPFFTTKGEGSGIGLANAQKVAASHGGVVALESREGEGSVFEVRLPLGPGGEGASGAGGEGGS